MTRSFTFIALVALAMALPACAPSPEDACQASCEQDQQCGLAEISGELEMQECVHDCLDSAEEAREVLDEECFDAQTSRLDCVANLDCEDFDEWAYGDPDQSMPYPCQDEDNEVIDICSGGSGGSCDCSSVVMDCTVTYNSLGQPTEHCTCSPSCCC